MAHSGIRILPSPCLRNETPDAGIAESIPMIIMQVYPWIRTDEWPFHE